MLAGRLIAMVAFSSDVSSIETCDSVFEAAAALSRSVLVVFCTVETGATTSKLGLFAQTETGLFRNSLRFDWKNSVKSMVRLLAKSTGAGTGMEQELTLLLESSLEISAEDPRRSNFPIVLQGDGDRLLSLFLAL